MSGFVALKSTIEAEKSDDVAVVRMEKLSVRGGISQPDERGRARVVGIASVDGSI